MILENLIFEEDEDITLVQSVNEDEISANDVDSTITDDRSKSGIDQIISLNKIYLLNKIMTVIILFYSC